MIRSWWLHLLDGLGHYAIRPGAFAKVTNSKSMTREKIRPRTGANILPKLSKFTPKAINSTPNTSKQSNDPSTTKVGPQEHRSWNHEDPTEDIPPHPQITLAHYTPHHGPHRYRNALTHQGCIYSSDTENKLPDHTNRRGTDGKTQTLKGGI